MNNVINGDYSFLKSKMLIKDITTQITHFGKDNNLDINDACLRFSITTFLDLLSRVINYHYEIIKCCVADKDNFRENFKDINDYLKGLLDTQITQPKKDKKNFIQLTNEDVVNKIKQKICETKKKRILDVHKTLSNANLLTCKKKKSARHSSINKSTKPINNKKKMINLTGNIIEKITIKEYINTIPTKKENKKSYSHEKFCNNLNNTLWTTISETMNRSHKSASIQKIRASNYITTLMNKSRKILDEYNRNGYIRRREWNGRKLISKSVS